MVGFSAMVAACRSRPAAFVLLLMAGCADPTPRPARWRETNGPVRVEVEWPTNQFGVGEPARVRLWVDHPVGGTPAVVEPAGASNQVIVLERQVRPGRRRGERAVHEWRWRVTSFEFGRHALWTGFPVVVAAEGRVEFPVCPAAIDVVPVRDARQSDWGPLKGPAVWPGRFPRWLWVFGLIAALAAALGWGTARLLRRPPPPPPPPPPPDRVALAALERLRASGAMEAGQTEYVYVELSRIVRAYLEARFGLHAPERTTEEFLREAAESGALAATHQACLKNFLTACDLVKFARERPGADEMLSAFETARQFVEETAPAAGAAQEQPR
ncbi:MAG: hypothetical protein N2652_03185 [Kiritimatiellae bacterium]|nr:hypothetical protein [Kiritimatiellia bacterium]